MSRRTVAAAFVLVAATLLGGSAVTVLAQAQGSALEGSISKMSGMTLTLTLADGGTEAVTLTPGTLVLARQPTALETIRPNDPLGVAARRESDGSLTADGINIFSPELWNRVRKGQFPMQSGDVMTNALATDYALGVQGHVLHVRYGDTEATIKVPDGVPINRISIERSTDLKEGMHVAVRGTVNADGTVVAGSVTFERAPHG
jgi:hypothetical protein